MNNTSYISEEKEKEQMLSRFNAAYAIAGKRWMDLVISVNANYDSKAGSDAMKRIIADRKTGRRIRIDKLTEITTALETAIGITENV